METKHILGLKELSPEEIELVFETADSFKEILSRPIKKVPTLRGKQIALLFYEPSTRTRISFETAAKILSADVCNINVSTSSVRKGESLKDTIKTLEALKIDLLVIRHSTSGVGEFISKVANFSVINGGDGMHEHPTQGLLDIFTVREKKRKLKGLKIAIVGDVLHSRVARSNIWGFSKMGAEVRVCGPKTMLPKEIEKMPVKVFFNMDEAIRDVDVIMMLRLQLERQSAGLFPSLYEYSKFYGLNAERLKLAKENVLVMHPGPMNRGVEITKDVAESISSVIEEQVTNGIVIRMALLYLLLSGREEQ
jgi:aspartate carbamoyltransferase catalytic subunit